MFRSILAGTLLAATPLGAQTTATAARDRAILAAVLREASAGSDLQARIYAVAGDTAIVAVWQTNPPRDTTLGEGLIHAVTVVRRSDEWVRVGPRRPIGALPPKPEYAPTKLMPPKPGNRISRP